MSPFPRGNVAMLGIAIALCAIVDVSTGMLLIDLYIYIFKHLYVHYDLYTDMFSHDFDFCNIKVLPMRPTSLPK